MNLYVNARKIEPNGQADPGRRLLATLETLEAQGQAVQSIIVDGQPNTLDLESLLFAASAGSIRDLHLATVPAQQLMQETVDEVVAVLPPLADELRAIAVALQRGQDEEAFATLSPALEGLQSYLQVLALLVDHSDLGREARQAFETINAGLQQISAALEQRDLVLLADLLLYELAPEIEQEHKWLTQNAGVEAV